MAHSSERVQALIRDVRSRWRRRALLQGAALSSVVLALAGILLILVYRAFEPPPIALGIGAAIGVAAVGIVITRYVIRPALRRISDAEVAMFVEEQLPELEDRLNSAVELEVREASRRAHGQIIERLVEDASERTRMIPIAALIDPRRARVLTTAGGICVLVFLALAVSSFQDLRTTLSAAELRAAMLASRPLLSVQPGDAEIEQGASQEIIAALRERTDRPVHLSYRSGAGAWQRVSMQPDLVGEEFLHAFTNVQEPIEYFVEHDEHRTEVYAITLYEFPAVEQIDVTYFFPEYTGRHPETERGTGDIAGLKGTEVQIAVHASGDVEEGVLMIAGKDAVALHPEGDSLYVGRLTLEEPGYYTVQLTDAAGKRNRFPEEYQISLIEDARPAVSITHPQRDVQANAIEEVVIAAEAHDDYGVGNLRLHFAVNGGDERTLELSGNAPSSSTEVTGEHVFFLEDFELQPGDVISYYADARDGFHKQPSATDMYFIEVIPFDRDYRQAGSGAGMAGGGQSGVVLNQQQIIAATWKLVRERPEMPDAEYSSSRQALTQAQENLRSNIEQRVNSTAFSLELQRNEDNRRIAEYLRSAAEAMGEAVIELRADRLRDALGPERRALNFLLRAEALNRERQIALSRGQQSGGSASATEERMTELMDLELDISKDKYEMLPQRSGASAQQEMDETLERLRELARRQQNLANDNQRPLEGEDLRRHVERLQRDQEQLRRQAETLSRSLSREASSAQRGGMQQELNRAIERMEEAERALRRGDHQRAQAQQQQAINDLERMTRRLEATAAGSQRASAEALGREYEQIREQERRIARELEQFATEGGEQRPDRSDLEEMLERRTDALERLQRMTDRAEQLSSRESTERELATAARELSRALSREDIEGQMSRSRESIERGWFENAARRQQDIESSLDRLEEWVRGLEAFVPVQDEERLTRSLQAVERLERAMRDLEAMETDAGMLEGNGTQPPRNPEPYEQGEQPGGQAESGQPGREQTPVQQGVGTGQERAGAETSRGSANGSTEDGLTDRARRQEAALRQARLEQARDALERLRKDLEGSPALDALNRMQRALGRADHAGVSLQGETAREFFSQEVFAPLSQIEEVLRRELDQIAMDKKLFGSRPGNVPPEYRELVERYYESLSKGGSQ